LASETNKDYFIMIFQNKLAKQVVLLKIF